MDKKSIKNSVLVVIFVVLAPLILVGLTALQMQHKLQKKQPKYQKKQNQQQIMIYLKQMIKKSQIIHHQIIKIRIKTQEQ